MNKYQKALNTIADTLTYYTVRKDLALLPSDNEIFDSMATLREIVNKETPKKPVVIQDDIFGDYHLVCPNCGQGAIVIATRTDGKLYPRCPFCGQKLKEECKKGNEDV